VTETKVFKLIGDLGGLFLTILLIDADHHRVELAAGHRFVLERKILRKDFVEQQTSGGGFADFAAERYFHRSLEFYLAVIKRQDDYIDAAEGLSLSALGILLIIGQVVAAQDDILFDV
jgi:hypothetical protein